MIDITIVNQISLRRLLILCQTPCSSSDASVWMQEINEKYELGDNKRNYPLIPQRLTQKHKLEDYSFDTCRDNQKKVLSYILQYFKTWFKSDKTANASRAFTPLRMTLCGVARSGKSTLINTLGT